MAIYWWKEALDLPDDPVSGARISKLTGAPMNNINIYCELPYGTPDGKRIAYTRALTPDPRIPPYELCVAEIPTLRVASIEPVVASHLVATASWSGIIHYLRPNGELVRVDLTTLEKEIVITHCDLPPQMVFSSTSPDQRFLLGTVARPDYTSAVARVDLQRREWRVIYEHKEVLCHLQVNPVNGRDVLIQLNYGSGVDHLGRRQPVAGTGRGATHFLIDIDGGNYRPLRVGEPYTASSCGHAAWVADTGRVGLAVNWKGMTVRPEALARGNLHDDRHPEGNFVTIGPEDDRPRIFQAPEHIFNHVCVSKCGRYFVCDSYRNGMGRPIELVIGNLETGRYRTIVSDCGAQGGGPACSHPHAYLTADNRYVIYNSDRYGLCHVHAAHVPPGFLEDLDRARG